MSTSQTNDLNVAASQTTVVKAAYWVSGSQPVSDINSTLFTHLFCAFADLNPTTHRVTISKSNLPAFSTFTQTVQGNNPNVKTLLSIGGGESICSTFADMAREASHRKTFIDSSIKLARDYSFDGLDLDWEYPKTEAEMTDFGSLIKEWHDAVLLEATTSKSTPLLLTAAVFRSAINYPFLVVSASLDWINVKSYDYYGPTFDVGKTQTYPPAALKSGKSRSLVNSNEGILSWITALRSANKIVIGLPFFGYAWKLTSPSDLGLDAPASGPALGTNGDQWYNQIRCLIDSGGYEKQYDKDVVSNYCYSGTELVWIGYDDEESIKAKVSYAKEKKLLGYFAWHTGADTLSSTLSKEASDKWDELEGH